jgi:3'(2'), 5'-bisphosphate nucleotidase
LGAHKQVANGKRKNIRVADHKENSAWRVVGSRSHAGDTLNEVLQHIGSYEMISMGSSLKFCLVAEGSADVYPRLGPTSLWDTAAAQCIVEQAEGKVIKLTGEPLCYENVSEILNPFFIVLGKNNMNWIDMLSVVLVPAKSLS